MEQTLSQEDIINLILKTINSIFSNIFSSLDNNIYSSMDKFVFVNDKIISSSVFKNLLDSHGLIYITDALLLAITLYYVVRLYYSNYVEISIEKPFQFIFKLFVFAFFVNFSYFLCQQLLTINYLLSSSIQEIGQNVSGNEISFSSLISKLNSKISISSTTSFDLFSFDGIIKSITSLGLLNLLFSYSIRYIIIQFFVLSSPLAILTLINSSSAWIFKSWLKSFISLLILQVFIPLILIIIFSVDDSNKILYIGSIYALTKLNDYIRQILGGINVEFSNNFGSLLNILKK